MKHLLTIFATLATFISSANAQFDPFAEEESQLKSNVTFLSEQQSIAPGKPFKVAMKLEIPDKWHSYYINPGLVGVPMQFKWDLPNGFTAGDIEWQTPHIAKMMGMNTYGYSHIAYYPVTITPPANLKPGQTISIKLKAKWQICDDQSCVAEPNSNGTFGDYSLTLTTAQEPITDPSSAEDFAQIHKHTPAPTDGWTVKATNSSDTITLHLTPPAQLSLEDGKVYYFDRDQQTDAQAEQILTRSGSSYTLTIPRNNGSENDKTPGPVLKKLRGILSIKGGEKSYLIDTPFSVDATASPLSPVTLDGKTEKKLNLWSAIGFAFLGGIILNLMPCVFPVLGIKIMGFVQQAGEDPRKIKLHGLAFGAGLLISLWILAGVLIALILGGKTLGWGFQLNNPVFLSVMIILMFVLGLNLTGVFEIGTSLSGVGGELQSKKGYKGSFFSGVLTTLIATPCTGPFLGTTMGYTLQQPPVIAFIVFTALGLGIASPYILLSFFPALINKLPRPGAWMETFKQVMAFPLYATVIFFLNGFGSLTGTAGLSWMLLALLIIAIGLWIYGRWHTPLRSKKARSLAIVFTLVFIFLGFYTTKHAVAQKQVASDTATQSDHLFQWEKWKPGIVEELQAQGKIVFLDYTADG